MGSILFARNESIAHVMRHVTARAVTSCVHHACIHASKLAAQIIRGTPGFTYGHAIRASQTIFIKNNHLTF